MRDEVMIEEDMMFTKDDAPQKVDRNMKRATRPWLQYLLIFLVFLAAACFANFRSPNIFESDSFYYIRHAWLLRTNGIFDTQFPWTQYSVVRLLGTDLWYGFQLFLIPFTYFPDLTLAIKLAAFAITFLVLAMCFFAFKNLGVRFPAFWSLALLFSTPETLHRMAMTRPHPLSLGLNLLIFSLLIQKSQKSCGLIFIFSALLAFIHPVLFWLPLFTLAVICASQKIARQPISWSGVRALVAGTLAGLMARPHPFASLKLMYIQLVAMPLAKPKLFLATGMEHQAPFWNMIIDNLGFLIFLAVPLAIFLIHTFFFQSKEKISAPTKVAISSSLILTLVFISFYFFTRRAIDVWPGSLFVLAAVTISHYMDRFKQGELFAFKKYFKPLFIVMILGLCLIGYHTIVVSAGYQERAYSRTTLKEPALWLRDHTKKGEIVFHTYWSYFPHLFFWNQKNFYINGMDSIFLYAYSKNLFWKVYYIAFHDNLAGITCGYEKCGPETVESVHDVLIRDFKASYVFLKKDVNPGFCDYMESNQTEFEKVFDKNRDVIFKVLPSGGVSVSRMHAGREAPKQERKPVRSPAEVTGEENT